MSGTRRKLLRADARLVAQRLNGVHLPHMARADDPLVVHCSGCDLVTVVRKDELPHCAGCGQDLCDDCKGKLERKAAN